ncbi:hypothetical protein EDB19DRAFT_1734709, partial [Suillus lakei]
PSLPPGALVSHPFLTFFLSFYSKCTYHCYVQRGGARGPQGFSGALCLFIATIHLLPHSSFNMGRRRSNLSTVSKVKEAILQPTGNLRTLHSNLTKLRADRLAFEREQAQSQLANNATARQLLAEAALEIGTTVNLSADIQYLDYPGMDFDMGQEEDYVDEEDEPQDEEEASDGISRHEGSAVDVARAHVIYW